MKSVQRPSTDRVCWTAEHQSVLEELLQYLKEPPVMAYPNFSLPFILHCDASELGLGAVLNQEQGGEVRVVSYGSRTLTPAEKNYYLHSGKLEFLAMKWAVTEKFHDFLYYASSFTVLSDCNPLSYLLTSAKLNATTIRWVGELANYNFTIKYRPGKQSVDCDFLSRYPCERGSEDEVELDPETIGAIVAGCKEKGKYARVGSVAADSITDPVGKIDPSEVKRAQEEDAVISCVLHWIGSGGMPSKAERKDLTMPVKALLNQVKNLELNNHGVLVRRKKDGVQLVIPEKYKKLVYAELHEKMGHLGADRVVQLAQERFYWPYLSQEIHHYVQNVCRCIKQKKRNREERAPLQTIMTSEPFELVGIDYVHLDKAVGGYEYLLVVVDHFTHFAQVYSTKNKSGRAAADKIFNNFVLKFGFPKTLHHDQGQEFECKLFKRLQELAGVEASRTTPYHPQGNGKVERFNRTILNMLKTLEEKEKRRWADHVDKLVFAYNCTRNDTTTFSPFYLLFGRSPRLPVDFLFNLEDDEDEISVSHSDFVGSWEQAMSDAYAVVRDNAKKSADRRKKHYDQKVFGACLDVGDRVLVRNVSERGGTGKLRSYWEDDIYVVVARKNPEIPVYTVETESKRSKKKVRVLHRNLLLPCDHLPVDLEEVEKVESKKKKRRSSQPGNRKTSGKSEEELSSDDEDMERLQIAAEELIRLGEQGGNSCSDYKVVVDRGGDFDSEGEGDVEDHSGDELVETRSHFEVDGLGSTVDLEDGVSGIDLEGGVSDVDLEDGVSNFEERSGRESSFSLVDSRSEDELSDVGGKARSERDGDELIRDLDIGDLGHPDIDSTAQPAEEAHISNNETDESTYNSTEESTDEDHHSGRGLRTRVPRKQFTFDKLGTPTIR